MSEINYSLDRLRVDVAERLHIRKVLYALKKEFSVNGQRVIELGSGTGCNLKLFLPENDVLGIEGLADAARIASDEGVRTLVSNLEMPLPLPSADFDWILILDVLEHLVNPEISLRESHRLLKPSGKVLVNVPNHFTLTGRLKILLGEGIHWNHFFPQSKTWNDPHIRFYTRDSIVELLTVCGFRVIRDLSVVAPAVPMSHQMRLIGLGGLVERLAQKYPALFCGGFFLLAERA